MARCASIDPLGFHNFRVSAQDSLGCKYDDQKADKSGERLSEKNIYANPFEWTQCWWTGLGIYAALNVRQLAAHERLFLAPGVEEGAASSRYSEQLMSIVGDHRDEVMALMRPDHFNPYGLRKYPATHAASGTTHPPSLPAIARRGEWSQGHIFDVYLHFAAAGDHYLGRILACLDPNHASFATLPPHWNLRNPLNNQHIMKAMDMMFSPVLEAYKRKANDPTAILLRCLACVVHHSVEIKKTMLQYPGHGFVKITILHDEELLVELRMLVTTEPTVGVMTTPTGVPPHVELATNVQKLLSMVTQLVNSLGTQTNGLIDAVKTAIENQAWESGHVTGSKLKEILEEFNNKQLKAVNDRLAEVRDKFHSANIGDRPRATRLAPARRAIDNSIVTTVFMYDGKFYGVPKEYEFPKKLTIGEALRFYLNGQTVSDDGSARVWPFAKLSCELLPKRLRIPFKMSFK